MWRFKVVLLGIGFRASWRVLVGPRVQESAPGQRSMQVYRVHYFGLFGALKLRRDLDWGTLVVERALQGLSWYKAGIDGLYKGYIRRWDSKSPPEAAADLCIQSAKLAACILVSIEAQDSRDSRNLICGILVFLRSLEPL